MAGRRRSSTAASLPLPPVAALLLLWVFSWGRVTADTDTANMTALQKHVAFFDRDNDGIITPLETFQGFVAIGCEAAFSTAAATTVNGALGPITNPRCITRPLSCTNIDVKHIDKAMHGSDTGAYDAKGRFVPEKFEEIFKKYAKVRSDALTIFELEAMLTLNRDPLDPASWAAAEAEWQLIYQLARDNFGFLHKDSVRGIYDGSIFVKLAERWSSSRNDM